MPPRVFPTLAPARASIRDEMRGILTKDNAGIPIGNWYGCRMKDSTSCQR